MILVNIFKRAFLLVIWFIAILLDALLIIITLGIWDGKIRSRKPLLNEIVNDYF